MTGERTRLLLIRAGSRLYRDYSLRALAERYDVWLFADRGATWETPYIVGHTLVDTSDVDRMLALARPLACEGVLTWNDNRVVQTAQLAQRLGLPTSPAEAVLNCRDKHRTRAALAAAGVPQAQSRLVASVAGARAAATEIGFPLVLKPRALNASKGVVLVESADQLARRFQLARTATASGATEVAHGDVLVEEYLDGPEVSVDAAWYDGKPTLAFVARKECGFPPYFEEVGHLVNGDDPLLADPAITDVLTNAHAAVGFTTGWTHTELRLTAAGPKIVEINARIGGDRIPDVARLALGVDAASVAAALACGQKPDLTPHLRRVAAIGFLYPERDCVVRSVTIDSGRLPASVDTAVALALPGQTLELPPAGHVSSRYAQVTVAANSVQECRTELEKAMAAVHLDVLAWR